MLKVQLKGRKGLSSRVEFIKPGVQSKALAMCRYMHGSPVEKPNLVSLSRQLAPTPAGKESNKSSYHNSCNAVAKITVPVSVASR